MSGQKQCHGDMATETFETTFLPGTDSYQPTLDLDARLMKSGAIIHRNVLWALGAGVVPIPIVDVLALTGVQVKLVKELSELYGVSFKERLARNLVGSLLVSVGGVGVGAMVGASLAKFIPVIGTALGVVSVPVTAGAFTHAVGRVFVMHFEAGGTLLDFDPKAMRDHFRTEFTAAKVEVTRMQKPVVPSPVTPPSASKPS